MSIFRNFYLALTIAMMCCCNAFGQSHKFEILNELSSFEDVHYLFNGIRQVSLSREDVSSLERIYLNPLEYVRSDYSSLAKISALNILIQAKRNGFDVSEDIVQKGADYAADCLYSVDEYTFRSALNVLSVYDRKEDYSTLIKLAKNSSDRNFNSIIVAMVSMCNSFDEKVFDTFLESIAPYKRKVASEIKLNFLSFSKDNGWCK